MLLLMAVQDEEWDEVDMMVRQFQNMTQLIKFSRSRWWRRRSGWRWAAAARSACMPRARQPHAELYMGLVEAGVGCCPAAAAARR